MSSGAKSLYGIDANFYMVFAGPVPPNPSELLGQERFSTLCTQLREQYDNHLECADLLKAAAENGIPKKAHCDALVFECVRLVEEILRNRRKI